jgi:hypothetical protein
MAASHTPWTVSGEKTVAAAGTRERLVAASLKVKSVTIVARSTNTGQIYVGGVDVASTTNFGLDASESVTFTTPEKHYIDLFEIYLDASVNGDDVDFYAVKP